MGAKNYGFVGLFVAGNFGDDVFLVNWRADFVGHGKTRANFSRISEHCARKSEGVFARDYRLRQSLELAVADIGVAIEEQAFAGAFPEDGSGSGFDGAIDDVWLAKIFVEEVGPGRTQISVDEENGAVELGAARCKILRRAVGDIHDVGFNTAARCGRRPSEAYGAKRKFYFAEQFEARVAFGPS